MYSLSINFVSVLLAGVGSMILGFLWYGPFFGKTWMKSLGITNADVASSTKKEIALSYAATFACALITAFVLALFIHNLFVPTIIQAVQIAFWAAIGFMAMTHITTFLFTPKKSYKALLISIGYYFFSFIIQAIIIFIFS